MGSIILALSIVIGALLALNEGVNTLGATIGITRGSTNISYISALIGATIATVLGVALLSGKIIATVSKNLVQLDATGMFSVMVAIVIVLIAATLIFKGVPISTTYVVIGALTGYGLIARGSLDLGTLKIIIVSLFATPLIALAAGYGVFCLIRSGIIKKLKSIQKIERFEMMFIAPSFAGMLLLAFALGANSIGVVIGLLGNALESSTLVLIGAAGLIAGIILFGKRTSRKVGMELADLSPSRGFIAMLVSGIVMMAFVHFGIPTSATQTILGSLIGVSLATKFVNPKEAARVSFAWLVLLPAAILGATVLISGLIGTLL